MLDSFNLIFPFSAELSSIDDNISLGQLTVVQHVSVALSSILQLDSEKCNNQFVKIKFANYCNILMMDSCN